jgi:hypothetical protein
MTPPDPIPYATSVTPLPGRTRLWAAAAIVFAGLALIVLGGCFLIGVLSITTYLPNPIPIPTSQFQLQLIILYTLAAACFLSAIVLLVLGLKGLFRVMGT